jgi:hypothetical protein
MQPGSLSQASDRRFARSAAPNQTLPNFFGTLIALLTLSFPLALISQPTRSSPSHDVTAQSARDHSPTNLHHQPLAKVPAAQPD